MSYLPRDWQRWLFRPVSRSAGQRAEAGVALAVASERAINSERAENRGTAANPNTAASNARFAPSVAALIVLAIGFRLMALFLLRYGGPNPEWSDFGYYHEMAALSAQGFYPDLQFWVEYPPLFPWLAVAAYVVGSHLPVWVQPSFWFELILSTVLALGDAGAIVAIDRLGDAFWGAPAGRRSATFYAALFLPTFAIIGWFDTLPVSALLIGTALLVAASRRPDFRKRWPLLALAGFALAIGIMLKLFPILGLAAALIVGPLPGTVKAANGRNEGSRASLGGAIGPSWPEIRWRTLNLVVAGAAAIATAVAIALPFLILNRSTFLATFRNVASRGSWETIWALLDGYYGTGVIAALHDRLYFNASATWGQAYGHAGLWWITVALGASFFIWRVLTAIRQGTPRAAVATVGLALVLVMLVSRGFSPQYILWILPFTALALPGLLGALLAVALSFDALVVESYIYVTLFQNVLSLLWISVLVRMAILAWLAFELAVAISPATAARLDRVRPYFRVPAIVATVAVVALIGTILAPRLTPEGEKRDGTAAVAAVLATLPSNAAVVFTQPDTYDRLAPLARPRAATLIADSNYLKWTGDQSLVRRLDDVLATHPEVALVGDPSQPNPDVEAAVRAWLERRYGLATSTSAGSFAVAVYQQSLAPPEKAIQTHFGSSIVLVGFHAPDRPAPTGPAILVTLHWQASTSVPTDYSESLQLLDGQGKLVAQQDAMPDNNTMPTAGWRVGEQIYDSLALTPAKPLAPGAYRLILVVYDHQTLQRLPVSGDGAAGDHAELATITVQ